MTDILKKLKTYKKDEPEDVYVIINELLQLCKEAADEIERLLKALGKIAEPIGVPVGTDKQMYKRWRKVATDRIDIARAALEGK